MTKRTTICLNMVIWVVKFPREGKIDMFVQNKHNRRHGILLPKLFLPTVRKNCSSDREKLLKFKAEGREFVKNSFGQ